MDGKRKMRLGEAGKRKIKLGEVNVRLREMKARLVFEISSVEQQCYE